MASTYTPSLKIELMATGGGGSHAHTLTKDVKYYDFIIASKS